MIVFVDHTRRGALNARLDELKGYEKNWDGYEATPPSSEQIRIFRNVLKHLTILPSFVDCYPDGTLFLNYDYIDREDEILVEIVDENNFKLITKLDFLHPEFYNLKALNQVIEIYHKSREKQIYD